MPLPGKIDSHFSSADTGAKGWELDAEKLLELLEEATSGITSSEVVDDDENSQSNIDELLNEDENFWGDIPGDESVEELSIKLEEDNLFEDHLGQNAEFLAVFLRQNRNFLDDSHLCHYAPQFKPAVLASDIHNDSNTIVLVFTGASGHGKRTEMNAFISYLLSGYLEDRARVLVIDNRGAKQTASMTQSITCYRIRPLAPVFNSKTMLIVDLPGFGDS
ncbi:hypothetical protein G7Z17_g8724 [Cylindrodendrum hubeiense]|uniref:Uncharacterized protein n=1 Tax=Cylindrodendrum hubeiense TaxID=595255 RepID=A0A9P5LCX9_9HYPO|nr:hypothetical protein G7Z17_g8724 [Cylindrodendrum hubeiense]